MSLITTLHIHHVVSFVLLLDNFLTVRRFLCLKERQLSHNSSQKKALRTSNWSGQDGKGKSSIPKPSESDDIPRNRQRRGRFPHTLPPAVAGTRTGHLVENRALDLDDPDNITSLSSGDRNFDDDQRGESADEVDPEPLPGPFGDVVEQNVAPGLAPPPQRGRFLCLLCRRFFYVDVPEGFAFRNMPRICAACRRQHGDEDPDLNPDLVPQRRRRRIR
ncbi:hypothetical protein TNCT_556911 [Trichonephila clavata]|uniref:Uncharacterized protein n=1 Tax=Trichonephila clavata TaxID=2740835 RepID=A0A8X6FZ84_TRICU|nr:hypothetical protein TNCT_556911 [Trichonephila clavata]